MKCYLVLATALFTTACASPEERRRAELMDTIEENIRLPADAGAMTRFARAYKFASPDRVVAFYFVPGGHDASFCQGAQEGGRTNGQIALACPPPKGMKAGERRWLDDDVHLPDVCDGGCGYVDVEYDVRTKAVIFSECHGGP